MAQVEHYRNPRTPAHLERIERARVDEPLLDDACWTCGYPLLLIDLSEPFRSIHNRVYCSVCVRGIRDQENDQGN